MAESHVISGLVAKCSELSGELEYHQNKIKQIGHDVAVLESAIKIIDPDYDLRTIKAKQRRVKNNFFAHGEGNTLLMDLFRESKGRISTSQIIERAAQKKGYDLASIDRKAFTASLFTTIKRLQAKGVVNEVDRVNNVIVWELV